ncbi:transposase [bacterium]|nr:transposase [bacterium]
MARAARHIDSNVPYHITHRGKNKEKVFFNKLDYFKYLEILSNNCKKYRIDVWAYCLMPNHIHLIVSAESAGSVSLTIQQTTRSYTYWRKIQDKSKVNWDQRFHSIPMDEKHLLYAARYIEQNPMRAGLVSRPEEWLYSSAVAHINDKDDLLVNVSLLVDYADDWESALQENVPDDMIPEFWKKKDK